MPRVLRMQPNSAVASDRLPEQQRQRKQFCETRSGDGRADSFKLRAIKESAVGTFQWPIQTKVMIDASNESSASEPIVRGHCLIHGNFPRTKGRRLGTFCDIE